MQGNVYDMSSLHMLAIKTKTFRDLIDESPFTKSDVVTIQVSILRTTATLGEVKGHRLIRSGGAFTPVCHWICFPESPEQDPENLGARDLSSYDYVKSDKRVEGMSTQSDIRSLVLNALTLPLRSVTLYVNF
jgi:peptidyl-prolyl cis-trans isomerase-like protein 2